MGTAQPAGSTMRAPNGPDPVRKKEGENVEFVDLTPANLDSEHICCIIRKKPHPGVETKRRWLRERLAEGHVFRKLSGNGCAFIEYAPLEGAWVPVEGENYLYLYCLWVTGEPKGRGVGRALMESCIAEAKARGKSGICMLGADKQKAWLSDQSFAEKFGFEMVDTTPGGYQLLALSFDGSAPQFAPQAKRETIDSPNLTIFYDYQCPFIPDRIAKLRDFCEQSGIPADFILVDSLEKAKSLPCPFNNWAVFYGGKLETVNQLDAAGIRRLMKK